MNKIVCATLAGLATVPTFLFFTQPAKADWRVERKETYCYPVTTAQVHRNAADHPNAYVDGYSEGRQSARKGQQYRPRTAGGEFARGFEDGYFGRRFTGQQYAVPDKVEYFAGQQCDTRSVHSDRNRYRRYR